MLYNMKRRLAKEKPTSPSSPTAKEAGSARWSTPPTPGVPRAQSWAWGLESHRYEKLLGQGGGSLQTTTRLPAQQGPAQAPGPP